MRVLMLGPLVVERDGRQVDLGGPRQRSVLAVLLLARGRAVANPVRLPGRLLDGLGVAGLQPLEGAVESVVARLMLT